MMLIPLMTLKRLLLAKKGLENTISDVIILFERKKVNPKNH